MPTSWEECSYLMVWTRFQNLYHDIIIFTIRKRRAGRCRCSTNRSSPIYPTNSETNNPPLRRPRGPDRMVQMVSSWYMIKAARWPPRQMYILPEYRLLQGKSEYRLLQGKYVEHRNVFQQFWKFHFVNRNHILKSLLHQWQANYRKMLSLWNIYIKYIHLDRCTSRNTKWYIHKIPLIFSLFVTSRPN